MPQIPYDDWSRLPAEDQSRLASYYPLNLFRMLSHADRVGFAHIDMGRALLRGGRLDPRLRELAILRVGHVCSSAYEVHQHRAFAARVGVSAEQIDAVLGLGDLAPLGPAWESVIAVVDQLCHRTKPTPERLAAAQGVLSSGELVELILLIGYYMATARLLETLEVEIEDVPPLGEALTLRPNPSSGSFLGPEQSAAAKAT